MMSRTTVTLPILDARSATGCLVLLLLALPALTTAQHDASGEVLGKQKISDTSGGFSGVLDDHDNFGFSSAALGDFNGDGIPDLAVGAHGDDDGGSDRGAVWLLFLNADGTVGSHAKISSTTSGFTSALEDNDLFGVSVVSLGDMDGDSITELAVGALFDDFQGAVWILFLNADGSVKGHTRIAPGSGGFTGTLDMGDDFGRSLAALGDLDGDGVADLAVGARRDDDGGNNRGAVWLLFLNADGTVKSHAKISDTAGGFTGVLADSVQFGDGLATLGNMDEDFVTELAVGASLDGDGGPFRGAVWVLFLNSDGSVKTHTKISDTAGGFTGVLDDADVFGTSVASLGDLDGDCVTDLAVGAPLDDDGGMFEQDQGAVWLLFLNADGTVKAHTKLSNTSGGLGAVAPNFGHFGTSVTMLGDLDADGTDELAVGVEWDDDGGVPIAADRGAEWVLFLDGWQDPWANLGESLAGTHGTPCLHGTGTLAGGTSLSILLGNALQDASAWLTYGITRLDAPFKGGVLVPDINPPGAFVALTTDGLGRLVINDTWPTGVPSGFSIYFQYWIQDPAGPANFSASNAIRGTTP